MTLKTIFASVLVVALSGNSIYANSHHIPSDYNIVFEENFNGTDIDSNYWTPQVYGNGVGNAEMQYYQPENLIVDQGYLNIEARVENRSDNTGWVPHSFTSGRLSTLGKKAFRYGRIAIKAKVPNIPGTHFAFWLGAFDTNVKGFPAAGNMDIVQSGIYGQFKEVEGHFQYADSDNLQDITRFYYSDSTFDASDAFHIYEVEWEPTQITFYVDGNVTGTVHKTQENEAAFETYYYLNVNLGLQSPYSIYGGLQSYDLLNTLPGTAEVDWVKVWQKPGIGDIKTNYGPTTPATKIEGGNFVIRADDTPAMYRYSYTEGQLLAFWTNNINLAHPVEEYDPKYPLLPLKEALQPDAYEGGKFMDYTINFTGTGWSGGGWYTEYPIDISSFNGGSLVFYLKSEFDFGFMNAGMIDQNGGQVELSVLDYSNFQPDGNWHRVEIPLSDYVAGGMDMSKLVYPLYIATQEPAEGTEPIRYGIDNIYFKWNSDNTLIYNNPVENTLVFNFKFDEPKKNFKVKIKVDGKKQPTITLKNLVPEINPDGSANYLWHSCLNYPIGSVIEAQVMGVNPGKDYFPGDNNTYSAQFTVTKEPFQNNTNCK